LEEAELFVVAEAQISLNGAGAGDDLINAGEKN